MDNPEGQNSPNISFDSQKIGTRPTVNYFSNIDGGGKDDKKVQRRRTRLTRKALVIVLVALGAVLLIVTTVFLVNVLSGEKPREYNSSDFPEDINDFEKKAYSLVYSESWSYGETATFIGYAIADSKDPERALRLKLLHAEFMRLGGYEESAENEIKYLLENTYDVGQQYLVLMAASNFYYNFGDQSLAELYQWQAGQLDVPENMADYLDDFSAEEPFNPETDQYTWEQSNPDPTADSNGGQEE